MNNGQRALAMLARLAFLRAAFAAPKKKRRWEPGEPFRRRGRGWRSSFPTDSVVGARDGRRYRVAADGSLRREDMPQGRVRRSKKARLRARRAAR